jgi:hypothetical protein
LSYCRSSVFTFVFFMQNLKGISSGYNNKSCSINYHGYNKIGFTFFQIFCDFLHNLQESAFHFNYWRCTFAERTSGRKEDLQCGPRVGRPARACRNPAITGGGARRGGLGKDLWVTRDWFGYSVGGEMSPVGGAPAARGYRPPRLAKPARGTSGGGWCWPVSYC